MPLCCRRATPSGKAAREEPCVLFGSSQRLSEAFGRTDIDEGTRCELLGLDPEPAVDRGL